MTIETQTLWFGVASQSLVLTVDRPLSSVTSVAVYEMDADDTSTAESATIGAAAVDTATEATTAAAGDGETDPKKLLVASTTGFIAGRRYWISSLGRGEEFEAERIHASTAIYARHPLASAYASGATLAGSLRATIAASDTWVAEVTNLSPNLNPHPRYRVKWEVVHDDGETVVHERNVDLLRYGAVPSVSPIDVDTAVPMWLDSLPTDHRASRGKLLIAEALRALKLDLYRDGIADQALRTAEVFAELVIRRTVVATIEAKIEAGAQGMEAALDIAVRRYDARMKGLVESPVLALDRTGAGAASKKERAVPLWVR